MYRKLLGHIAGSPKRCFAVGAGLSFFLCVLGFMFSWGPPRLDSSIAEIFFGRTFLWLVFAAVYYRVLCPVAVDRKRSHKAREVFADAYFIILGFEGVRAIGDFVAGYTFLQAVASLVPIVICISIAYRILLKRYRAAGASIVEN